jgi:hypothetical protein
LHGWTYQVKSVSDSTEPASISVLFGAFSKQFEFAVFELLLQSLKGDEKTSREMTNAVYAKIKEEATIIGWKTKRSSEKRMRIAIYDILSGNNYFVEVKLLRIPFRTLGSYQHMSRLPKIMRLHCTSKGRGKANDLD